MTLIAVLVVLAFLFESRIVKSSISSESLVAFPIVVVTLVVLLQMGKLG